MTKNCRVINGIYIAYFVFKLNYQYSNLNLCLHIKFNY